MYAQNNIKLNACKQGLKRFYFKYLTINLQYLYNVDLQNVFY
jgi:hypothetical protein